MSMWSNDKTFIVCPLWPLARVNTATVLKVNHFMPMLTHDGNDFKKFKIFWGSYDTMYLGKLGRSLNTPDKKKEK